MSTSNPRLVSICIDKVVEASNDSESDSFSSTTRRECTVILKYTPSHFRPISNKEREQILTRYYLAAGPITSDSNSGSGTESDSDSSSSESLPATNTSSLGSSGRPKYTSPIKSPRKDIRSPSPHANFSRKKPLSKPNPTIDSPELKPLSVPSSPPKRRGPPREAHQSSAKRSKVTEPLVPSASHRRTASTAKETVSKPRWQKQDLIVFIALSQIPGQVAKRSELLKAAVDLDRKISKEKGLPYTFKGKTPQNSASACLTINKDNLFRRITVPGSNVQYFGLTNPTGNFDLAVQRYKQWEEKLYRVFFPISFSPDEDSEDEDLLSKSKITEPAVGLGEESHDSSTANAPSPLRNGKDSFSTGEDDVGPMIVSLLEGPDEKNSPTSEEIPAPPKKLLGKIPTSWKDILEVRASTIPGAGMGLFAKAFIPADTTLGYYFGVPLTEYEFDSTKDNVGLASHYSIMYQYMVLDATDANGMPFTDPDGPIYCPFHFMNEDKNRVNAAFHEGLEYNQISCHTLVDIFPGQELFVFYGTEFERDHYTLD